MDILGALKKEAAKHRQQLETVEKAIEILSKGGKAPGTRKRRAMSAATKAKIARGVRRAMKAKTKGE